MDIAKWLESIGRNPQTVSLDSKNLLQLLSDFYEGRNESMPKNQLSIFDEIIDKKVESVEKQSKDDFLQELQEMKFEPIVNDNSFSLQDWQEEIIEMTKDEPNVLMDMEIETEQSNIQDEEYVRELELLNAELEQDKAEGLLLDDEPFFIEDKKLIVVRYRSEILPNIPNLAKQIIDSKWKQNINPENISVEMQQEEDRDIYSHVVCTNEYGVRFHVLMDEIIEKLNKIPFDLL